MLLSTLCSPNYFSVVLGGNPEHVLMVQAAGDQDVVRLSNPKERIPRNYLELILWKISTVNNDIILEIFDGNVSRQRCQSTATCGVTVACLLRSTPPWTRLYCRTTFKCECCFNTSCIFHSRCHVIRPRVSCRRSPRS